MAGPEFVGSQMNPSKHSYWPDPTKASGYQISI